MTADAVDEGLFTVGIRPLVYSLWFSLTSDCGVDQVLLGRSREAFQAMFLLTGVTAVCSTGLPDQMHRAPATGIDGTARRCVVFGEAAFHVGGDAGIKRAIRAP